MTMIYCVIPRELEAELFSRMEDHYRDNDGIEVIIDRRRAGPDRRRSAPGMSADERRAVRERRRARAPGTFPRIDAPPV
jgi:hypothetical protein